MSGCLIATRLPHDASALGVIESVWAAGDALLPLDPALTEVELARLLARLRPHALTDGSSEKALPDPAPIGPGTALVMTTSGTTGAPKGVLLGSAALQTAAASTNHAVGAGPGDRWLCCLPLNHIAGFMTLLRSHTLGTEAVVHPRFEVEAVASEKDAAFVSLVPTMLYRLLEAGVDLRRFSRILVGGASVDDALVERARALGARVTVTYGMTETCGGVVYDGAPLENVDVALDREGRISIASPTLMYGYRCDEAATGNALSDGRFVTQDRGEWTEDGRLRVIERLDRAIVSGGKKIWPGEVEDVLRIHPGVLDAVVRGEPDETWGQTVVAVVTPRDEFRPPTAEELTKFLRDHISTYKIPRSVRIAQSKSR